LRLTWSLQYAILLPMFEFVPKPEPDEASPEEAAADPAVLRAERRLALLAEMAEIGMALMRGLRPAEPESQGADPGRDPIEAFARVSRAVRLTLALEARTDQELADLKAGVVRRLADERERAHARRVRAAKDMRHRIEGIMVPLMESETESAEAFDDLYEAMRQRLDDDEGYQDCQDWPARRIVEHLCRDLQLSPDWSGWTEDGWLEPGELKRSMGSVFSTPSRAPFDEDEPPPRWAAAERAAEYAIGPPDPPTASGP
jgi:hypothetical protein